MIDFVSFFAMFAYMFIPKKTRERNWVFVLAFLALGYVYVQKNPTPNYLTFENLDDLLFPILIMFFPFIWEFALRKDKEEEAKQPLSEPH